MCCRFLTDHRRLNVAITRARKALYIIGHLRTFQFNKHWNNLIAHAEKQSVIVRVDESMNCAKECVSGMKVDSSVSVTKNQACIKDEPKHDEIQSSSTVMKTSIPLLTIPTTKVVDRSAFSSQRRSIQYTDALPKSKPINSPNKNASTAGKCKLSLTNELRSEELPLPKALHFLLTDDQHKTSSKHTKPKALIGLKDQAVSSATGKQKVAPPSPVASKTVKSRLSSSKSATNMQKLKQVSRPHYRTQLMSKSISQRIEQTIDEKKSKVSSKTEGISSVMFSSVNRLKSSDSSSVMEMMACSDKTVCSVPSKVNVQSPSTSRQSEFSSASHEYNRTEKWGGKRYRVSHYVNRSDPRTKKPKLT